MIVEIKGLCGNTEAGWSCYFCREPNIPEIGVFHYLKGGSHGSV
jgi:hypothetical protein